MSAGMIRVHRDDQIATITLDRADKRNALTPEGLRELERVALAFREDAETRAVIVRGEGRDFSVGADLSRMDDRTRKPPNLLTLRRIAEQGAQLMRALEEIPQPTIALVHGVSTGGATCIASACDFRFGTDDCRMGYGEVKIGINLMWNAVPRCVRLIGPARAKKMIMTGALVPAAELHRWGFLDEVLPAAQLTARGQEFAAELAALPPVAVQMIKRSIDVVSGAMDRAIMHMDADQWILATRSKDFEEGVRAFFEKRPPRFTGD